VRLRVGRVELSGDLALAAQARGVVVFAHGSGSSRHSPRNRHVAALLEEAGFGSLLLDLLSRDEEEVDRLTARFRFDIGLLANRLIAATQWLRESGPATPLPIGYFGASTGAAAAFVAAAERPAGIRAVVSRGGRPDLAMDHLPLVSAPALLIVGELDREVIAMNQAALAQLRVEKELVIVPGASHLFEEPGALDEVARLAAAWFRRHLPEAGDSS
jgi:pimeloyl-ACP methyl ester carboxylesterase